MTSFNTVAVMAGGLLLLLVVVPAWNYRRNNNVSLKENETRAHVPSKSAVLVTGGGRGIGRSIADHLIQQGFVVLVTVRQQSQFDELEKQTTKLGPHPVILDVTNDSHVDAAVKRVKDVLKEQKVELVAIVNNAGINPEGDIIADQIQANNKRLENEFADLSIASRVLETNVIGVARTTKAFLPILRTVKDARIVNIGSYFGSIAGKIGLSHAYYESSKFALEGLSDNMRRSLGPEGINVSLVKPGNIATDMNKMAGEVGPDVVAREVEHAIASLHPHPRYYPGKIFGRSVWLSCWIFEVLPTWIVDKL